MKFISPRREQDFTNITMKLLAYILWGCQLVAATSPEDLQFQQQQGHPSSGLIQNPVVSCDNEKRKLLCLPPEYSKFDLPFRNDFNFIDIGTIFIQILNTFYQFFDFISQLDSRISMKF